MEPVFREVIAKIKPTEDEVSKSLDIFENISAFIKENYGLSAKLMGSVAKDTFLSGDKDLDIFVFFPEDYSRDKLEKKALDIGKAVFCRFGGGKYEVSYAEHPYTKGFVEGFEVEIVPAYLIRNTRQLLSAVDRTPFHTNYVVSNLKNNDEVRLLKKFLKGIGCYGSDLKTEGFSGYLCEILVMHYGSFMKTVTEAQNWKRQQIIDVENIYHKEDYNKVRKIFKDQPIIVIDPIDKRRNVAAVMSVEKLSKFIVSSRRFVKKPELRYFFPKKRKINGRALIKSYDKKGLFIYALTFERPDIIEDVLYPQLKRLRMTLSKYLERHDIDIIDAWVFADDECGIGFICGNTVVSNYKRIQGPSVFNPLKHQEMFVNKHKNVWLEDDRYVTDIKRECSEVEVCVKRFFSGSVNALAERGVPGNIAKMVAKKFRLLSGKDVLKIKSSEFLEGACKENIK